VKNDEKLTEIAKLSAEKTVGHDNIVYIPKSGANEDFSWYRKIAPSVFAFIGCKKEGYSDGRLKASKFDMDETSLTSMAAFFCQFAVDYLARE